MSKFTDERQPGCAAAAPPVRMPLKARCESLCSFAGLMAHVVQACDPTLSSFAYWWLGRRKRRVEWLHFHSMNVSVRDICDSGFKSDSVSVAILRSDHIMRRRGEEPHIWGRRSERISLGCKHIELHTCPTSSGLLTPNVMLLR